MPDFSHLYDGTFAVFYLVADKEYSKNIDIACTQGFYREQAVINGAELCPRAKDCGCGPMGKEFCL